MLVEKVYRHAESDPDKVAVVAGASRVTYGELQRLSLRVAVYLTDRRIGPGKVVGICLPRTADPIICMLGVLLSGAAYTLLEYEGDDPVELARMKLSRADLVITTADRSRQLGELPVPKVLFTNIETATATATGRESAQLMTIPQSLSPDSPAYVLYTSGSTGPPKGVAVTHGNVRHYVESLLERLQINVPLSYAHVSSLSADLGNTCLFLPLWSGGVVHLVDYQERGDPQLLMSYLSSQSIDFLKTTPSHWGAVFRTIHTAEHRPRLKYLLLGGEPLSAGLAQETLRHGVTHTLVNHYGPTEATIGVSVKLLRQEADIDHSRSGSVPIGTPLGDTKLVVRTDSGARMDRSAVGELFIGGPLVAAGYLDDPAANKKAFVTDEKGEQRFYRTGDLVRLDDDGEATFLGRTDRQVKISGFRVGLEYVESVIREMAGVQDAACQLLTVGARQAIVAGVVTDSASVMESLGAQLREHLAAYMLPSRLLRLPDLPRNGNGKLDTHSVRRQLTDALAVPGGTEGTLNTTEEVELQRVIQLFRKHLGRDDFSVDDDFFELGGNSLDAIQVIAELQRSGYKVTTTSFLAAPTARVLAGLLEMPPAARMGSMEPTPASCAHSQFSEAQRWFFEQDFTQPNHWNQAVLFQVTGRDSGRVDPQLLRQCVDELVRLHPLLHSSYRVVDGRWVAETVDPPASSFSESTLNLGDKHHVAIQIQATARRLQTEINLENGAIFRTHLFKGPDHDYLLMVCHHLSVDAVSWRIMIGDLAYLYGRYARGLPADVRGELTGFWEWARQTAQHSAETVASDDPVPGNNEASASAAWLVLSDGETAELMRELPATFDAPMHEILLGAFVHIMTSRRRLAKVLVDVETHGREDFPDLDVSRTVGWFTKTYRLELSRAAGRRAMIRSTIDMMRRASADDGSSIRQVRSVRRPLISYNYLGRMDLPFDEELRLLPADYSIGPARGDANDRVHDLKFTARILDGRLAIDLSFSTEHEDQADMAALLDDLRKLLFDFGDSQQEKADSAAWVSKGSTTGLLGHVPAEPSQSDAICSRRDYRNIMLTGATGYIGVHLLHELVAKTDAHLYCLVRATDDRAALRRLTDVYQWYFPGHESDIRPGRITVIAGDASEPGIGVPDDTYRRMRADVEAIYHLAGDTRLFSRRDIARRANVDSVREVIRLASTGRPKDLHHMSTLAVCGYNVGSAPIPFTEDSLDIGQQFLNEYEDSKFLAELLVRRFVAEGGTGYVYRAGNVTGHSKTGRFQRNADQNRFIQLIRALVKLGRVPGGVNEEIVVSPVDVVAEAVFALSVSSSVPSGTYHVDGCHAIKYTRIIDALRQLGFPLQRSSHSTMKDLLSEYTDVGDPDLALAYFWANRESRNVIYRHTVTHPLLAGLGVRFEPMDEAWIRRFLLHLIDQNVLARPRPEESTFRALTS